MICIFVRMSCACMSVFAEMIAQCGRIKASHWLFQDRDGVPNIASFNFHQDNDLANGHPKSLVTVVAKLSTGAPCLCFCC
jgi:hypothetical protein